MIWSEGMGVVQYEGMGMVWSKGMGVVFILLACFDLAPLVSANVFLVSSKFEYIHFFCVQDHFFIANHIDGR